ncbi:hypothetical protein [Vreelandella aquamarina]|uniref:hypothetical protein n=1 Tax=Vreelandella aquamarina TaxID=77097 RepID=UPI000781A5B2|nr:MULTISPECIES: hypothetical protein [Halomonas]MCC4289481.1 hypothetical protein [Halomonas meridiana]
MRLTNADKQGIAEAAKVMASAGRIDMEGVQRAVKAINGAMPTAAQAHERLVAGMRALNGK